MITYYCDNCPYSFGSKSGLAVRDARIEHIDDCPANKPGFFIPKNKEKTREQTSENT